MTLRKLTLASVTAAALTLPLVASADSDLALGAAGTTAAQAQLNFQIVIPTFVYFQVGTAGAGNVDTVNFDLVAANEEPGSTNPVAGAAGSGAVGVTLRTNAASIRISASSTNLDDGLGNLIPIAEVTAADGGTITVPDFGTDTGLLAPAGVSSSDTWTFTYDNTNVYPAGTYGAAGTGIVTYTAADF
jgi:hypothetical protein